MSEEKILCPFCGSELEIGESRNGWCAHCRNTSNCGLLIDRGDDNPYVLIDHINNLPRLDEKSKAEIALEIFKEFDNSVRPSKMFENDWDKFMNWLDEKSKGEK